MTDRAIEKAHEATQDVSASSLTLLWGTWEMWCDLPLQFENCHSGRGVGGGGQSTTATATAATGLIDPGGNNSWLDRVKSIGLFDSAEGFWGLFNCTLLPSQLPPNGSYYMFRKNIAPMWEHEANRRGGKWVIPFTIPLSDVSVTADSAQENALSVNVAWQRLCLAAIGEQLPGSEEEICGVTVSRGKVRSHGASGQVGEWKLCLWTRTSEDEESQVQIAHYIKELLSSPTAEVDAATGNTSDPEEGGDDSSMSVTPTRQKASSGTFALLYMPHRELMEAKQRFQKGSTGAAPFSPKYTA